MPIEDTKMFTKRSFNLLIVAALMMLTACVPGVAPTPTSPTVTSAPTEAVSPVLEPNTEAAVRSEGLPPNGIWQATLTPEDFVQRGVLRYVAEEDWAGVYTWNFQDGKAQLDFEGTIKTGAFTCKAEYAAVGDVVRFAFTTSVPSGTCDGIVDEVQWRLEDDGLHFHLVATSDNPFVEIQTTYDAKSFQQIVD
jgi:hypothetical protein